MPLTSDRTPGGSHAASPRAIRSPPSSRNTVSTSTITVFTVRPTVAPSRLSTCWLSWLASLLVRVITSLLRLPKSVGSPLATAQFCSWPSRVSPWASQPGRAVISSSSWVTSRGSSHSAASTTPPRARPSTSSRARGRGSPCSTSQRVGRSSRKASRAAARNRAGNGARGTSNCRSTHRFSTSSGRARPNRSQGGSTSRSSMGLGAAESNRAGIVGSA